MKNSTVTLYNIDELPKASIETAIKHYAEINVSYDWWEVIYAHFTDICKVIGATVNPKKTWFRGFYARGFRVTFEATLDVKKTIFSISSETLLGKYPKIQLTLPPCPLQPRVISLIAKGWIQPAFEIVPANQGAAFCTTFSYVDYGSDGHSHPRIKEEVELLKDWLQEITFCLYNFFYESLKAEYDYQTGRDAIINTIRSSEFLFTRDGRPANHLETIATDISSPSP